MKTNCENSNFKLWHIYFFNFLEIPSAQFFWLNFQSFNVQWRLRQLKKAKFLELWILELHWYLILDNAKILITNHLNTANKQKRVATIGWAILTIFSIFSIHTVEMLLALWILREFLLYKTICFYRFILLKFHNF